MAPGKDLLHIVELTTYAPAATWLWTRKESRLNWKLKVSNTADNAGITQ